MAIGAVLLPNATHPAAAAPPLIGAAPTVPPGIGLPADYVMPPATYGVEYELGRVIPMTDGTQITADVRYPTDPATGRRAPGQFPVVVNWTTYGALNGVITSLLTSVFDRLGIVLPDNLKDLRRVINQATSAQDLLVSRGYIEVIADVRGTGASTGEWNPASIQDGIDGNQVVDWAAQLPGSNGNVGMFGYSFPGVSAMRTAEYTQSGTPLKAMVMHDMANDVYKHAVSHGGMFTPVLLTVLIPMVHAMGIIFPLLNLPFTPQVTLPALIDHLRGAFTSPDAPLRKLIDGYAGGTHAYKDEWWQERDYSTRLNTLVDNDIPTYFIDGSWDLYQDGAFKNYAQLQNIAAGNPQYGPMDPNTPGDPRFQLLQGPWYHVTQGGGPYARMDTDPVTIAWFDRWLKGIDNGIDKMPGTLHMIDQTARGANTTAYPFAEATPTTFHVGPGTLGDQPAPAGTPWDRIAYSPIDGICNRDNFEQWTLGFVQAALNVFNVSDPCGTYNTGPQSGPIYTSAPVPEPTVVAGPGTLTTFVSSSTDDAAVQVYLDDVAPDGSSANITGGAQLASMRSLDEEQTWRTEDGSVYAPEHNYATADRRPIQPGEIVQLEIRIRPAYYRLEAGHSLRIRISTGSFPTTIAPPNLIPGLLGSNVDIHHDVDHPTRLVVPLAPADSLQP